MEYFFFLVRRTLIYRKCIYRYREFNKIMIFLWEMESPTKEINPLNSNAKVQYFD